MRNLGYSEILVLTMVFCLIPVAILAMIYFIRRLQTKERLQAIEKGVPLADRRDPWERAAAVRHNGIMSLAAGPGIFIMFVGIHQLVGSAGLLVMGVGVAAIPTLVGCGQLLEYWLRVQDLRSQESRPKREA